MSETCLNDSSSWWIADGCSDNEEDDCCGGDCGCGNDVNKKDDDCQGFICVFCQQKICCKKADKCLTAKGYVCPDCQKRMRKNPVT